MSPNEQPPQGSVQVNIGMGDRVDLLWLPPDGRPRRTTGFVIGGGGDGDAARIIICGLEDRRPGIHEVRMSMLMAGEPLPEYDASGLDSHMNQIARMLAACGHVAAVMLGMRRLVAKGQVDESTATHAVSAAIGKLTGMLAKDGERACSASAAFARNCEEASSHEQQGNEAVASNSVDSCSPGPGEQCSPNGVAASQLHKQQGTEARDNTSKN